ncbi:MAG: ABC transporter permease subunit [Anaerolineae bacterium]|nr:ABC transporter permease subunit [Anaerolineae bacterium]
MTSMTSTQASATATMADKRREETIAGYLFMSPMMVIFLIFLFIPIAFALFVSFTNWNGITPLGQTQSQTTGVVLFTNLTTDPVTIPAGTIVTTEGGSPIRYRLTADVTLEAGTEATAEGSIVALDEFAGSGGNTRRDSITAIEGDLAEAVSVTNPSALASGQDNAYQFVGLANYQDLLFKQGIRQRDFFLSLKNTVYFVLGVVPAQTVLALVLAVIVNQKWLKGKGIFRTAFYFPSITSSVVISIIFLWLFARGGVVNVLISALFPNYDPVTWLNDPNGVIHNILGLVGITRDTVGDWASSRIVGLTLWDWISGPSVTLFTIMILNTWTTIGTLMIIYLAALQGIPSQVYEAASIDGATTWQTFRRITVPLLAPTTFFVVTLGLIGTFQVFDQIAVMTSGGPAKTTLTIAYIVYSNGFNNSEMGLAAATALILFAIIFAFTLIQRRITRESLDAY